MRGSLHRPFQAVCAVALILEAGSLRPNDAAEDDSGKLTAQRSLLRQGGSSRELRSAPVAAHEAQSVLRASFLDTGDPQAANQSSDDNVAELVAEADDADGNTDRSGSDKTHDDTAQLKGTVGGDAQKTKQGANGATKARETDEQAEEKLENGQVASLTSSFKYFSLMAVAFAILFECVHDRWSSVDWETHDEILDAPADVSAEMTRLSLRGTGSIAAAYFTKDGKVFGTACFLGISVLILVDTVVEKKMNVITGIFWDAMQEKDQDRFFSGITCYLAMVPVPFLAGAYQTYVISMLCINWRQSLTRRLQRLWLENCTFSVGQLRAPDEKQGLENPDQRIEEDVPNFVSIWTSLVFGLLQSIPVFIVWMPIVLELSPNHILAMQSLPVFKPWLLCAVILWCFITSVVSHLVGKPVITLTYARERYNANFRMGLARIRNNADAIAVLHAEQHESRALEGQFERIKRTFWETMTITKRMAMIGFLLDQAGMLLPLLTLGHAYFRGEPGVTLGTFMRIRVAVSMVQDSMSWFVNSYFDIAHFRAITKRLNEMIDHCEKVNATRRLLQPELDTSLTPHCMKLVNAQGKLPTGSVLWNIEDLEIIEGTWTMVSGVEGAGKTTLMRVLAGTWPVSEATRLIFTKAIDAYDATLPEKRSTAEKTSARKPPEILCVPINAHLLRAKFRLKEAVCYPDAEDTWTDSEVVEALRIVGLAKLVDGQTGSLHADFGDRMLSAGESQRLELAHVLLRRPRWCFLDEPVSHIKESEREVLYGALREQLYGKSTVITITHNISSLASLHDQKFELRDGGLFKV